MVGLVIWDYIHYDVTVMDSNHSWSLGMEEELYAG